MNYIEKSYDVFQMFNDRWALVTAGDISNFNTMTIARDGDKVALTALEPVAVEHGVDFKQADLTFVCKKLYSHQFEKEQVPADVADWIYTRVPPHTMFIGEIVDVIER